MSSPLSCGHTIGLKGEQIGSEAYELGETDMSRVNRCRHGLRLGRNPRIYLRLSMIPNILELPAVSRLSPQ